MKYSLNLFRWINYLFNRIYYCRSRWLHYHASVPYTKSYILKKFKEAFRNTTINGMSMSEFYDVHINEETDKTPKIQ